MNLATESADTRRDAFTIAGERRGLLPPAHQERLLGVLDAGAALCSDGVS